MRWDDFYATMSSGPRSGQRVMQTVKTRLVDLGTTFSQARSDNGTCAPGRASMITGNLQVNHGIGAGNTTREYYDCYRWGKKNPSSGGHATRWIGPWEFDLAKIAGLPDTKVPYSTQASTLGVGGFTNNPTWGNGATGYGYTRADRAKLGDTSTPDDLQAFTGCLPNWLSENGVRCGMVGKYQNAYADTTDGRYTTPAEQYLFVPPGWDYWHALIGDDSKYNGGAQDHWRVHACHYNVASGTNAGAGWGKTGVEQTYRYDLPITSLTYAGGVATVTIGATPAREHHLSVGDEVHIEGCSPTGLNSNPGSAGQIVTSVIDPYTFTFATSVSGTGTATNAVGQVMYAYPRRNYGDLVWGYAGAEFVNSCGEYEPWYLYMSPDNPHQGVDSSGSNDDTHERERRYKDTVPQTDAVRWQGVAGAVSPATPTTGPGALTSSRQQQWQQRQEMLASTDDAIQIVLDACAARGWNNIIVLLTSDNGFQVGEQYANEGVDVWDMLGGKGFVYDGSVRLPFVIKHPKWAKGVTENFLVSQADVPLTVMDWHGLTNHHCHTTRDGYSLQRLMVDMSHPVRNRAQLITRGAWWRAGNGTDYGEAIVDANLKKLVRVAGVPTTRELWDRSNDVDYETVDISASYPALVNTLAARLDLLRDCRFDGTTNTCRTI